MPKMSKIRLLLGFFILFYGVIVVRLFYLQLIRPISGTDYLSTRKILPERGIIYDRNNQPLVTNQIKYRLYVEPKKVTDEEMLKIKLAHVLQVDEASIEAKLDMTKQWAAVYSGITEEQRNTIQSLHLGGVGFDALPVRYYPEGSSSAHILGFVGKNQDGDDVGNIGVEGFYDKDMAGLPGLIRSDRDLIDRPIFLGTQEKIDAENGRDLTLTIDKTVQEIIKRKLIEGVEKYKAKEGCVIVVQPYTLEILGLSCIPDFDPEHYWDFDPASYSNSAISSLYEPGSTFKPFIMAAAMQEGLITPDTIMNEDGPVQEGEYNIRTWNNQYEGKITMTRILEKSSNVGMVWVGKKLGNQKLLSYIKKYGFGQLTGIDLQGEVSGYIKPKGQWYPIDYDTATFGQGLAVSPIQMIRAFASIINGGNLMMPHVVKKLAGNTSGQTIQSQIITKIVSKDVSDKTKKMLVSTIENGETKYLKPKGYVVGGKTGTAQIAIQGHYDTSKTIASFIGFSPVEKPQFLALVILKEPSTSQWGSETAAPLFFEIAKELIVYYNIAPE